MALEDELMALEDELMVLEDELMVLDEMPGASLPVTSGNATTSSWCSMTG